MSQNLHINEYSRKEMMARVQRLNTQVKNQILSSENSKLQSENEQKEHLVWGITLSAVVVATALVALLLTLRHRRKNRAVPTAKRFYDKDVSHLLTTHIYNNKVLKTADWQLIEERLLASFPTFRDRLFSLYQLSETEYHICLLIKLEVSPSNMAKLMATGNSTISQSRLRMQQKVFNGQGTAKDWDNYVLSL
jgi:hypothetical protein